MGKQTIQTITDALIRLSSAISLADRTLRVSYVNGDLVLTCRCVIKAPGVDDHIVINPDSSEAEFLAVAVIICGRVGKCLEDLERLGLSRRDTLIIPDNVEAVMKYLQDRE